MLLLEGRAMLALVPSRANPGYIELVCFDGSKRHRRKDGTCRHQWDVLAQYADPDDVGRTLLAHYTSGQEGSA